MNKEQFISLLRSPATINLNLVKELEEITQQFPYFQNAHLLLAKQYQGHENIRYESYLRKAAAYAPDRSVLYRLIKLEPAEVIHMQKEHVGKPVKEQEITHTVQHEDLTEIKSAETPVSQPDISNKEEIHPQEIKSKEHSEPKIPEIKTVSETPVKVKKTEEPEVTKTETPSIIPVTAQKIQEAEVSKTETSSITPVTSQKTQEAEVTLTESPSIITVTNQKTEVPETTTPDVIPVTTQKVKETIDEVNEIKESKIPETKTASQLPDIAPKTTEHKVPETSTPSEVPVTPRKTDEVIVEDKAIKETNFQEIKTAPKDPVIAQKTKEPEVPVSDLSANVPATDQKINETIDESKELRESKIPETDLPSELPVKANTSKVESDSREILAKRLQEIATPKVEASQVPPTPVENNITQQPIPPSIPVQLEPREKTEKITEQPVSKPIIPKEITFEHHSFLEWLKIKDIPVLPADRHIDYFKENLKTGVIQQGDISDPENQIIDNFIKTEPRIVPAKSEFYSPGNMARQSAMEHEDLISETLARIYAQQGNIPKAIDAYRRLSLKLPEKSSYFAALIKELEEKEIE